MKKNRRWYYVSYYEEYPIYEPAEGGYYYAGNQLVVSYRYGSLRRARAGFKKQLKEFEKYYRPFTDIRKDVAYAYGKYVGKDRMLRIETVQGIRTRGYIPYE